MTSARLSDQSDIGLAPLPIPLTSFVGRERDIAAVAGLLREDGVRMVTLTGPGGVGKTRLALRVAGEVRGWFADGVAFVPLAAVSDPDLVGATVAHALGVREGVDRPVAEHLGDVLQDRSLLLVLDNFEQVVESAPLITTLLGACPNLRVLVTSRAMLRISGEHAYPVPPLSLPDPASAPAQLVEAEALRLFADRARAVDPDFALTPETAAAVAAICHRLDGLPLAVELAAAKIPMLPPQALLHRLAQRLPLLVGGPRELPVRLRTMRDAIGWSYALLTAEEQALFARLAIFTGGFTLEAGEGVAGNLGGDVFAGIESLAGQSLVRAVGIVAGQPRFDMLETVREFGLEALTASGDAGAVSDAHAAYFLALAELAEPNLAGPEQASWIAQLEADLPNIRAALAWFRQSGETENGLRLGGALARFWFRTSRFVEGGAQLEPLLELPGAVETLARAKVLTAVCELMDWRGDHARASVQGDEAIAICRKLGAPLLAESIYVRCSVALNQGDLRLAEALGRESLAVCRRAGDRLGEGRALGLLGIVAYARADWPAATGLMEEALPLKQESGDWYIVAVQLGDLAHVALVRGDHVRAAPLYREALAFFRVFGHDFRVAWCLTGLGGVAAAAGEAKQAARLFGAGAALLKVLGAPLRPAVQTNYDTIVARTRATLGEAAFAASWSAGAALPLEEAIAEAVAVTGESGVPPASALVPGTPFGLTPREQEVLRLLVAGKTDREIAETLFVGRRTASTHVANLLAKLEADNRTEAAAVAVRNGLV